MTCSLSSEDSGSKQVIYPKIVAGRVSRSRESPTEATKLPELWTVTPALKVVGVLRPVCSPHSAPTMALEQWDPPPLNEKVPGWEARW